MAAKDAPKLVGYFSRDGGHEHRIDLSLIRYMTADLKKVVPIDLSSFEVKNYKVDKEKYPFFRFILNHLDIIREIGGNSIMDAPIITKSSALFGLWYMFIFPKKFEEYTFTTHLLKGKIHFLLEKKSDETTTAGNAFSHALQSSTPDKEPEPDATADAIEHFFGVFQLQLKSHTLIYQNVIDCILANTDEKKTPLCDDDEASTLEDLRRREFVKFKTSYIRPNDKRFALRKTSELWLKGFLGNANVCVGFRSKDDIIDDIKMYNLQELRNMSLRFNPNEFFQQLDIVFMNIKKIFIQEATKLKYSDDVYNIPKITIRLASNQFGIFRRIDLNQENDLPDWYVNEINQML